jgi:dUTP pyrophosphatase
MNNTKYYLLKLFVDSDNIDLKNLYKNAIVKNNKVVENYLYGAGPSASTGPVHFDAGFDLFCPERLLSSGFQTIGLNQKVKTSMEFIDGPVTYPMNVGYYLYPRSSTGSKTPLRMSNSIGIIDSGYRGHITAFFDNWRGADYLVDQYQRLVQICPPNLTYPVYVCMVEKEEELGLTERGANGFGSSGK